MQTVTFEVKVAWWFTWLYCPGLKLLAKVVRYLGGIVALNEARVEFWARRACTVTVKPCQK